MDVSHPPAKELPVVNSGSRPGQDLFVNPVDIGDWVPGQHGALVHPWQTSRLAHKPIIMRELPCQNANYDDTLICDITSMQLQCHELYLRLNLSGFGSLPTSPLVEAPVASLVDECSLSYNGESILTMSPSQVLAECLIDDDSKYLSDREVAYGFSAAAGGTAKPTADANASTYYVPLNGFCRQVLQHFPLSSFPSKSWSLSIKLRGVQQLISGGSSTTPTGTISSAKMIFVGPLVTAEESSLVRAAISSGQGIEWNCLRSQAFRTTVANGSTSQEISHPSVKGSVARVVLLSRKKAGYDGTATNTNNPMDWWTPYTAAETMSFGTSDEPNLLFGQNMPIRAVKSFYARQANKSAMAYRLNSDSAVAQDSGIISLSFNEGQSDISDGTSSGSLIVRHNGQLNMTHVDPAADVYLDAIYYVHYKIVIADDKKQMFKSGIPVGMDTR